MAALPLKPTPEPTAATTAAAAPHDRVATTTLPYHGQAPLLRSRSLESLAAKPKPVLLAADQRRRRSLPTVIISSCQAPADPQMATDDDDHCHHHRRVRSSGNFNANRSGPRLRILYHDEVLCRRSQENVFRLLRIVQHDGGEPGASAATMTPDITLEPKRDCSTSVLLAKKALRYRKMLRRAEQVDLDDPAFDIARFVGVRWCKADGPTAEDDVAMPLPRMRRPCRWSRPQ